jgi:uncharacterized ferredoxin-like protein
MMALAAKTAPKTRGEDHIRIRILDAKEARGLAALMDRYGQETGAANFDRDAKGVRASGAVLLLSLENKTAGMNCGACGHRRCEELASADVGEFAGPLCAWRAIDLGIAAGSAAKTAAIFNADNRIMYRIGVVARKEGLIEGELVIGIPLAAGGKNIFFDR